MMRAQARVAAGLAMMGGRAQPLSLHAPTPRRCHASSKNDLAGVLHATPRAALKPSAARDFSRERFFLLSVNLKLRRTPRFSR